MSDTPQTFIDLYVQYCKEQTDAPPIFHRFLSYSVLSSVISKNAYLKFGFKRLYPNLYLLIVAPSSAHRKSWSMGIAARMIRRIYPDYIIPEVSSREAFVSELTDQNRLPLGCGMVKIDELKGFMDRVRNKSYMEGFLQDLSSLYDNDNLNRRKGIDNPERFKMEEPYLNMMAACSNDWFYQSVQSGDIAGGFLARFIWLVYEEPILKPSPWPAPENEALFTQCLQKLHNIQGFIGEMRLGAEAKAVYDQWFKKMSVAHQGGFWDANYHRSPAIVMKMAMLNALARNEARIDLPLSGPSLEIAEKDMKLAIYLIEDTHLNFAKITIGATKSHTMAKRVVKFIIEKGGTCNRTDILNGVRGITAKYLSDVLETLSQAAAIEVQKEGKGLIIKANGLSEKYLNG